MSAMEWVIWILIGGIVGWFASAVARMNQRSNLWTDVIVGSMGAMLGGILFYQAQPGLTVPNTWGLLVAGVGAVVLLELFRLFTFLIHIPITKH